jgi:hypothetical protein
MPPPDSVPLLPVEVGLDYTYPEPFGEAEVSFIFPAGKTFLLADDEPILVENLKAGDRVLLKEGQIATITDVRLYYEPPDPPAHYENGRVLSRVIGTIKHKGPAVVDVTWPGYTGTSSPGHPYYSVSRRCYVPAQELQVGEFLRTDDNLVTPVLAVSEPRYGLIDLYNFEVEHYHNYYVGKESGSAVLVHNGAAGPGGYITNTPEEAPRGRRLLSEDQLDAYARKYAEAVATNEPTRWTDFAPDLSTRQIRNVRRYAREQGYVSPAPVNEQGHADFTGHIFDHNGQLLDNVRLPEDLWLVPKERQSRYLNNQLFESDATPRRYVWHHHEEAGRMQLVEYGIHSITEHVGGSEAGGWSHYR